MKTGVLIVDDSEVYRNFLRQLVSSLPGVEVVSVASSAKLALPRIKYYQPNIVLLDYNMPEMDGLAAIPEIKKISPQSRIIMLSAYSDQAAALTVQALARGADDFIAKPNGLFEQSAQKLQQELQARIKVFAEKHSDTNSLASRQSLLKRDSLHTALRYCLIGISTGGPVALRHLLQQLPATLGGSILVVQHMPPLFTAQLAASLNSESPLTVVEAQNGMLVEPATVYIAPGGKHMLLEPEGKGAKVRIVDGHPDELCKPSANVLFQSAAGFCAKETLAILMTGMGEDGYLGMKELHSKGAYLMAQSAEDCVVFGMPARPIREGLVHEIHPVNGLAKKIAEYLSSDKNF
ncbi:MAG: chemotaxis-specific protein-glutamate methyltransferase CheB [Turneriella sp.]|nr:chemotaxis-specific protein-glutamate methyltransferase CheB [Leptospiraceae bacterium]MCX7632102.1 chemotaxis-specific protein-glutamate methyltransferase CheB [Turneriella sp.]